MAIRFSFAIILLTLNNCFAQEITGFRKFQDNFDFDVSGAGYFQKSNANLSNSALLPNYIKRVRQTYNGTFNSSWNRSTDNPLYHGAYYVSFNTRFRINNYIRTWASLTGESRGFSYGVTNTSNTQLFPQVKVEINKKFALLGDSIEFFSGVGNQINPRLYEGLTIYNLFQHGNDLYLKWRGIKFRYFQIPDLMNGIGLAIGDSYDYMLSYEKNLNKGMLEIQSGFSRYGYYGTPYRDIYNLSFGYSKASLFKLYVQCSYRPNDLQVFKREEMLGGLVGISWKKNGTGRFHNQSTVEGRYYGSGFNEGFKRTNVFYRNPNQGVYSNTVGPNLYPMLLFERPFSQWAVFTEYQQPGQYKNIGAIAIQSNNTYFIHKGFMIKCDLDLNYLFVQNEPSFLYPFYHTGIGWQEGNNLIMAGITNKTMNLDVHYPTFYYLGAPVFMVSLIRNLNETWFSSKY